MDTGNCVMTLQVSSCLPDSKSSNQKPAGLTDQIISLSRLKLPVGGDLNVQGQFDVHELLVLADLAGHVLFGSLQGILKVPDAELGGLDLLFLVGADGADVGVDVNVNGCQQLRVDCDGCDAPTTCTRETTALTESDAVCTTSTTVTSTASSTATAVSTAKLPVGGDLNVQGQFDVHELLVLADLAGHVLFGSLQGILKVPDAELGVLHCHLTALLSLSDLGLQVDTLRNSSEEIDLILKGVNLGLQLNLVHVGAIYILLEEKKIVSIVLNQALHVPQLSLQLHLLVAEPVELSAQVGDVIHRATPKRAPHLVNEAGEAVVQGLDLLFLVGADGADVGVDVNVNGCQQLRVDCDGCDAPTTCTRETTALTESDAVCTTSTTVTSTASSTATAVSTAVSTATTTKSTTTTTTTKSTTTTISTTTTTTHHG
ncbi:hypothetical protein F7725_000281 [Dissostichus mawsoni]|uniref:Uncharacterized protein n=1 Tax=Dissostichus mawsoni TaxID=36200 RepID=A0A7J5ZEG3_DISMA|nr:hypothetical protein F7725_000281 [Dissostichus mawsoni]